MRIKEIRQAKGISQRKAAIDLGLSPVVYGRYENGIRKPEPEMLATIADYFGVSVDELIGRDEPETKKAEPITSTSPQIVMMARAMEQMTPEQRDTMLNLGRAAFAQYFGINDENT